MSSVSQKGLPQRGNGWLPKGGKQILLAVGLVVAVAASVAYIVHYQNQQPKPLPLSAYEQMYKTMYGGQPQLSGSQGAAQKR
jgi:hypothetical protein